MIPRISLIWRPDDDVWVYLRGTLYSKKELRNLQAGSVSFRLTLDEKQSSEGSVFSYLLVADLPNQETVAVAVKHFESKTPSALSHEISLLESKLKLEVRVDDAIQTR